MASILTDVSEDDQSDDTASPDLLEEVVKWLNRERLMRRSEELMRNIREAEHTKDATLLKELLLEKMKVDGDLKSG